MKIVANYQHKQLASDGWQKLRLVEQMAHIGSEVERAIRWREKGNREYSQMAFVRALELLDLTLYSVKSGPQLREVARVREALVDSFVGDNQYQSSDLLWRHYFDPFTYASRIAT